jgi:hypothetical protein
MLHRAADEAIMNLKATQAVLTNRPEIEATSRWHGPTNPRTRPIWRTTAGI